MTRYNEWMCQECRSPLKVYAEPYVDPDDGEENPGQIELCGRCVRQERSEADSDGYDRGYDDGYAEGLGKPEDKAIQLMRYILDSVEDGEKPDPYYLILLKDML